MRLCLLCLLALLFDSSPARAQMSFLTDIFDQVNSLSMQVQRGDLLNSSELEPRQSPFGLRGLSFEVFLDLPSSEAAPLELGLGTSFMTGFRAEEETLDLRGAMRAFPSISVYVSMPEWLDKENVVPYAGLNFGLLELWNAQIYGRSGDENDRIEHGVSGETFEMGVTAGLAFEFAASNSFFVEGGVRRRKFASLDYSLTDGDPSIPELWPLELDASGWLVALGFQFELNKEDDE